MIACLPYWLVLLKHGITKLLFRSKCEESLRTYSADTAYSYLETFPRETALIITLINDLESNKLYANFKLIIS